MSVLLLRLAGPMQSWGTQSRFSVRDTGLEPSKSGIIGLLCAALGWQRDRETFPLESRQEEMTIAAFAQSLTMAVRVDREGRMSCDYHTAQEVRRADGKGIADTVLSHRYFLADADFLVGLHGDRLLLEHLDAALVAPVWPLYLGRKSFVPGKPIRVSPPFDGDLLEVLQSQPWFRQRHGEKPPDKPLRLVVETKFGDGPEVRQDVPLSFAQRKFTIRHVRTDFTPVPNVEDDLCCI